jgi:suppressor for copper-sensitivity B
MSRRMLPLVLLTIGVLAGDAYSQNPLSVTACFTAPNPQREALLFVTVRLQPGYWLYSVTQPTGGPNRTDIKVEESSAFTVLGSFEPLQPPMLERTELPGWPILEKHPGCISWQARIRFAPGVDPARLTIPGAVWGQVDTSEFCISPTDYPFNATLALPQISQRCCRPRHWLCKRLCP